jgi:di/tricarboxylate transporter
LVDDYVFLFLVLVVAITFFWSQRLRPDITAFLVMLSLIVPWPHLDGGWRAILTYEQGFSGFGSAAVLMIASMFVIGTSIVQTGAAEALGLRALRFAAERESLLQMMVLGIATLASMVINDTTVVIILLPLVMSLCREHGLAPSRYLLLVAYGSLLGGQWTLIGTRSNIILSDFLRQRHDTGIGFFDFTPTAAAVFAVCALFIFLVGRHWLPHAKGEAHPPSVTQFLTELVIPEGSKAIGKPVDQIESLSGDNVRIVATVRDGHRLPSWTPLAAGDMILIRSTADRIEAFVKSANFTVKEEAKLDRATLESVDLVSVEAVIPVHSYYAGATVNQLALDRRFGVTVLGMERRGRWLTDRPMDTRLQQGDALLILGNADNVERLGQSRDLLFLEERAFPAVGKTKAVLILGLLGGVITGAVSGVIAPTITIPLAAALAILLGCISVRAAYAAIDWPTLVILGGMIPYGIALEETGAAEAIAGLAIDTLSGFPPIALLAALLLIALAFTQIIENAAVAIIVAPIAYQIAQASGADPKSFMIPLAICVSAGFCTPVAHESTILVMGPGQYAFKDYAKLGSVLAIITWLVATLVTPMFWPLL